MCASLFPRPLLVFSGYVESIGISEFDKHGAFVPQVLYKKALRRNARAIHMKSYIYTYVNCVRATQARAVDGAQNSVLSRSLICSIGPKVVLLYTQDR